MAFVTTEERVDRLEASFGQFMTQMAVIEAHAEARNKEAEERNRQAQERFEGFQKEMAEFKDEMAEFKDEMAEFKDEMAEFKREMREDRRAMNKQWGELANKMGTLVEDIVAPCVRGLAERELGLGTIQRFCVRWEGRDPAEKNRWQEFDVLVIGEKAALVTSVKSKVRSQEDLVQLAELQRRFRHFFPEHAQLPVVGMLATLYLNESVCSQIAEAGFYGLAMGDENMEIVARPMLN